MSIKLNAQSGGSVALDAPTQTTSSADITLKLPVADGSNGQYLQTNGSGQLAFATVATGVDGITMADEWRITSNFTGDSNPISSNWERMDTTPWRSGNLGTGLTESSGVFTFPATGWYYIIWTHSCRRTGTSPWNYMLLQLTNDNSSYTDYDFSAGEFYSGGSWYWTKNSESVLLDITNTTNQKFRFKVDNDSGDVVTMGATDKKETGFTIIRLGDT